MTTHPLTPALAAAHYQRDGLKQSAIARRYGVSQMTVSRYLRGVGIDCQAWRAVARLSAAQREDRRRRQIPPAVAASIRQLRAAGASYRAVAAALDIKPTTCWKWVRALEEQA